jgi:alpha-tubulin suppressor-like RCC1 family protein
MPPMSWRFDRRVTRALALLGSSGLLSGFGCSVRTSVPAAEQGPALGSPCSTVADCPKPTNPCMGVDCVDGACRSEVTTAGTVPASQRPGDCLELVCDGRGKAIPREDRGDAPPDDSNDCTEERCGMDGPEHAPLAIGASCGSEGICNGEGLCGVCYPGKHRCEGNASELCEPTGQWSEPEACAGRAPVCNGGQCIGVGAIALGDRHACALLADRSARCWGSNNAGQAQGENRRSLPLRGAVELALGFGHGCARLADGAVHCWGSNEWGELGDGSLDDRSTPVEVYGVKGAAQIALGDDHSCARLGDGTVWCWGKNQQGQLGDGSATPASNPRQKIGERDVRELVAAEVARRGTHPDSTGMTVVLAGAPIAALALGGDRSCALLGDQSITCWGVDDLKPSLPELLPKLPLPGKSLPPDVPLPPTKPGLPTGKPPRPRGSEPSPIKVAPAAAMKAAAPPVPTGPKARAVRGLKGVAHVALGGNHSCALLQDGTAQCWGDNGKGELGDGSTIERHAPAKVKGLAGAREIALGLHHGCARLDDGSVLCWGQNDKGQLGDGSRADRNAPAPVPGISGAVGLFASGDRSCARLGSGEILCWGDNGKGELGDGSRETRAVPAPLRW